MDGLSPVGGELHRQLKPVRDYFPYLLGFCWKGDTKSLRVIYRGTLPKSGKLHGGNLGSLYRYPTENTQ